VAQPPLQIGNLDGVTQNANWLPATDDSLEALYRGAEAEAKQAQGLQPIGQGGGTTT